MKRALAFLALGLGVVAALDACVGLQIVCPVGTLGQRRMFSGGAEAEWCHRGDGVRQGIELRSYESGERMLLGAYLDGARTGEWAYYTKDEVEWRRDRWEDGALIGKTLTLPARPPNEAAVDVSAPTESLVVSLSSADPTLGRAVRQDELPVFAVWYGDGKPRVLGRYDREGFRTRVWQFWYEGGGLAREITYDAGLRDGAFQEWHANGRAKTDGAYVAGERDGRWRRWDEAGRLVADQTFAHAMLPP
jgi:hypothetical protein